MSDQDQRAAFEAIDLDWLLANISPGPWEACGKDRGGCSCGQIWSKPSDHPVATATTGKWGDSFPTLEIFGTSMDRTARAVIERIDYGEVRENAAKANAMLIAAEPDIAAELRRLRAEHDELVAAREVVQSARWIYENISSYTGLGFTLAAYDKVCERIPEPKE